jgi:hypothetical protein
MDLKAYADGIEKKSKALHEIGLAKLASDLDVFVSDLRDTREEISKSIKERENE